MKWYTLKLNNLFRNSSRINKKKRKGRGPGSGLGKTSGRGHKGLGSRSGGKIRVGFEGGQMPLQKRVPKYGFSSRVNRFSRDIGLSSLIPLKTIDIDLEILKKKHLINQSTKKVKVFKDIESCPKLKLRGILTTSSVKNMIEQAGGSVEN